MRVYARGNNRTREGFCMKTSAVTPSFYCFNIMLSLRANVRKKTKKILRKEICTLCKLLFSKFTRNRLRKFLKLLCISLFRCQKLWFKKNWGHRVNFLVISDIKRKNRSGKSFWNVAMVTADDKITAVLGQVYQKPENWYEPP